MPRTQIRKSRRRRVPDAFIARVARGACIEGGEGGRDKGDVEGESFEAGGEDDHDDEGREVEIGSPEVDEYNFVRTGILSGKTYFLDARFSLDCTLVYLSESE